MDWLHELARDFLLTCRDILPIVLLFGFFQLVVLRQRVANLGAILVGTVYVIIGLTLFLLGLEKALFPLGKLMAGQLVELSLPRGSAFDPTAWARFGWVYLFAALIGGHLLGEGDRVARVCGALCIAAGLTALGIG